MESDLDLSWSIILSTEFAAWRSSRSTGVGVATTKAPSVKAKARQETMRENNMMLRAVDSVRSSG